MGSKIAKWLICYYANKVSFRSILWSIGAISDEKAENRNKKDMMKVANLKEHLNLKDRYYFFQKSMKK